jgi:molybdenum cofactor synthesis domain-containing protein
LERRIMTQSPYPMISIEEAWRRIATHIERLEPTTMSLLESLGHVLAEDVTATENMPPFPSSAMDGYAIITGDSITERRVLGEQDAGQQKGLVVIPGTAVRIMTGAPVPQGADAVVPVEETREEDGFVHIASPASPGQYIRPIGQDVASGDLVVAKGTEIGPAEIGLLATVGRTQVPIYPRPRVAVMATGDELVPPDATPGPGQIRDSNSYALVAAVERAGFQAESMGRIPDDEQALRQALQRGVREADVLLTSGGVSMGRRDLIKPLLEELGTIHFGRVAVKPGKPLTYATVGGVSVFGLPGYPVSSLVAMENFVRPALRLMSGQSKLWRPQVTARLRHDVRHAPDRTEFQRAVVTQRDGVYKAETTGVQVSGRLKSLVGANALIRLPQGRGDFASGEEVTAILIDQPEVE